MQAVVCIKKDVLKYKVERLKTYEVKRFALTPLRVNYITMGNKVVKCTLKIKIYPEERGVTTCVTRFYFIYVLHLYSKYIKITPCMVCFECAWDVKGVS